LNGALYGMAGPAGATCDRNLSSTLEPGVVALLWDTMDIGAPAVGAGMFDVAPGSNALYAGGNPAAVPSLWAYDDWLAVTTPTVTAPADDYTAAIDPVTGRAEVIWAIWEPMGTGTGSVNVVTIQLWETAMGPGAAIPVNVAILAILPRADLAAIFFPLRANTEYSWQVRAWNTVSADRIRSPWSEERTFIVESGVPIVAPYEGPQLLSPAAGATDVGLNPGFSWAPVHGATEYEFILALNSALTETVEGTPVYVTEPSWQVPAGTLEYGTTYFWGVRVSQPTLGPQNISSFTTMEEVVEVWTCPVCGLTFDTEAELAAHWDAVHAPPPEVTPFWIWAVVGIGAILVIVVLVLIWRTRRPV